MASIPVLGMWEIFMKTTILSVLATFLLGICLSCAKDTLETPVRSEPSQLSGDGQTTPAPQTGPSVSELAPTTVGLYDIRSWEGRLYARASEALFPGNNLFESADGGKTWNKSVLVGDIDLRPGIAYVQPTKDYLWVAAGKFLLRRSSKSSSFEPVHQFPTSGLILASFLDSHLGYVVESVEMGCRILKTEDGGKTWRAVFKNGASGRPYDVKVISETVVLVAMNDEYILRTSDGGATWTPVELDELPPLGDREKQWVKLDRNGAAHLDVDSKNRIWVVGEKGSLYFSDDSGMHWSRPTIPAEIDRTVRFRSVAFSEGGAGVVVGDNGLILISSDTGSTWVKLSDSSRSVSRTTGANKDTDHLRSVVFVRETAIILGNDYVYSVVF
jgi:photosystem II stability/assembly factor-like uncharacterized protein